MENATKTHKPINFAEKLSLFSDQWQPRVIVELNDYQFKIVRIEGDFIWHDHQDTDEAFIVIEGTLRIDFRDGSVTLGPGGVTFLPDRGFDPDRLGQPRRVSLGPDVLVEGYVHGPR